MVRDAENTELKTLIKGVTNTVADLELGAVPAGMKRWVTFIKLTNELGAANSLYLCSGTTATDASLGIAKDVQALANQYDTLAYPDRPNLCTPLFSIAENKYLTAITTGGTMRVFMQYYDR